MAFKRSAVRSRLSPPKTDHEAKPYGLFYCKKEKLDTCQMKGENSRP